MSTTTSPEVVANLAPALTPAAEPEGVRRPVGWRPSLFTLGLVTTFFVLALLKTLAHCMWRDEWQAWLLACYHPTFSGLYYDVSHYEGHAALWHVCLWVLARCGLGYTSMQVFHVLVATAGVYAFVHWAPWSRLQKALFVFGYFPFFEYSTISRCYVFALLALPWACALIVSPKRRPIWTGVALALLAQSSAFGTAVSLAVGGAYVVVLWRDRRTGPRAAWWRWCCGGLIFLAGAGVTAYHCWLAVKLFPVDPFLEYTRHAPFTERAATGLRALWWGYMPLPPFAFSQWQTNFLDNWPAVVLTCGVIVGLLAVSLVVRNLNALALLLLGTLGFVGLCGGFPGSLRHHGHIYLLFLAAVWWAEAMPAAPAKRRWLAILDRWNGLRNPIFTGLLAVHCLAGVLTSVKDLAAPFSGSRDAARIIQEKFPAGVPVVADPAWAAGSVCGYLQRPIYFASRGDLRTYNLADTGSRFYPVPPEQLVELLRKILQESRSDVALVINYPLNVNGGGAEVVGITSPSVAPGEQYQVIRVKYSPQ